MTVITSTGSTTRLTSQIPSISGFYYPEYKIIRQDTIWDLYKEYAVKLARYEVLDNGLVYGEIRECPGVWAQSKSKTGCKEELKEVLSDWIELKQKDGDFPILNGININIA